MPTRPQRRSRRRPDGDILRPAIAETLEPRLMLAANLVISEFLASNDDGIEDSFLVHEDWIEIHNAGDATANLNDYFITDNPGNPEKWRFPVQNLAAGASLVVFASERDLAVAGQELHTNFKLDAAGEYLALIRAADDTVQFEYAPTYPVQSTDVSFGLTDSSNPNSARIYFSVPTPGALNAPSVAAPVFSVGGKTFQTSMQVSLSTTTPGATIYYTLNNTAPTTSSTVFTGPITLTGSKIVRAIATAPGYVNSPISSESYTAVDSTVNTFRSNLPIVVLESFNTTFTDANFVNASATFINTGVDGYADMLDPVNFTGRVGLRYRGSTSYSNYPKKPFAVEVRDEAGGDKNASILGMPADSDWVLYSPWTERSLMNNALALDWSRQLGNYASRIRFVEVYLNNDVDTQVNYTDDYLGVYILMEKPKLDDNRVNVTPVLPTATAEPDITGGYFFKKDRWESTISPPEIKIDTTGGAEVAWQRFVMVKPDETEMTGPQLTYLTNYLNELDGVMNGPNFADPVNGYAKYIDVDSWVDFWIMAEFTKSVDSFWLSTFYHKPQGGKIFMGPNWDFNLAFGQANYRDGASVSGYNHNSLIVHASFGDQYGYFARLFDDPTFKLKVTDRWQELRKTVLNTTKMMADMDAYVALLTDNNGNYPIGPGVPPQVSNNPAVRNFKKWPVLGVYSTTNSYFDPQGRWIDDVNLMKNWIKGRAEWMDTQFVPPPALSPTGGSFGSPTNVSMTPKAQATFTDTTVLGSGTAIKGLVPSATLSGWQNISFDASAWPISGTTGANTGVGYDTTTTPVNYASHIATNVQSQMFNVRSSIYLRFTFNIANPANIDHLILKMKYDDGFYAWVNGVRVIEGGVGENSVPAFNTNTGALPERDETAATQYVEWDISEIKSHLVAGTNVLAIQGVNKLLSNNDLLIVPQLYSRTYTNGTPAAQVYYTTDGSDPRNPVTGSPSATALLYSGPLAVNSSRRILARTLNAGVWSGIADEVYNFDANTLRVTEVMYNPPAPPVGSPYTAQDFEYIEVKNTGASTVNLSNFTFNNGVTFTFPPGTTLAPGAYGVIVENLAAFQSRYGTGLNVIGSYTGNLDNGGETVSFANGFAQTMQSFTFDDAWHPLTDGGGHSLVIINPNGALGNWDLAASWRASYEANGSPGAVDTDVNPPVFQSALFNPTNGDLTFTYNENVSIGDTSNVDVTEVTTNSPVTPSQYSASGHNAIVSLNALPSGLYRVTLPTAAVTDGFGNPMPSPVTYTFLLVNAAQTLVLPTTADAYIVDQLNVAATGKLNMRDNDLVVRNGDLGSWNGSAYTGVTGLIQSGSNGYVWDGNGIITTLPGDAGAFTMIGATTAAAMFGISGNQTEAWGNQIVHAGDVLIKYTYVGDVDLNGWLDGDDYFYLDSYVLQSGTVFGYTFGDLNLDGELNGDDYFWLDSQILSQGPPL